MSEEKIIEMFPGARQQSEEDEPQPCPHVVGILEHILSEAQAGRVIAVASVFITNEGEIGEAIYCEAITAPMVMAGLNMANYQLCSRVAHGE